MHMYNTSFYIVECKFYDRDADMNSRLKFVSGVSSG